jgi:hypothetical protein
MTFTLSRCDTQASTFCFLFLFFLFVFSRAAFLCHEAGQLGLAEGLS